MNIEKPLPRNEIDFLKRLLLKYRLLISVITLISIIVSIVYALYIHQPIYKANTLVKIGKIKGKLLIPTKELELTLLEKYSIYSNSAKKLPKISNIKNMQTSKGIIRLSAWGSDEKQLILFLENTIKDISRKNNILVKEFIQERRKELDIASRNVKESREKFKNIQQQIKKNDKYIETIKDPYLLNISMLKLLRSDRLLEKTYSRITAFNRVIAQCKKDLLQINTFPTHIIDSVMVETKSVTPGKFMIVLIGSVSGFLFSLLLAFFLSYIFTKRD